MQKIVKRHGIRSIKLQECADFKSIKPKNNNINLSFKKDQWILNLYFKTDKSRKKIVKKQSNSRYLNEKKCKIECFFFIFIFALFYKKKHEQKIFKYEERYVLFQFA